MLGTDLQKRKREKWKGFLESEQETKTKHFLPCWNISKKNSRKPHQKGDVEVEGYRGKKSLGNEWQHRRDIQMQSTSLHLSLKSFKWSFQWLTLIFWSWKPDCLPGSFSNQCLRCWLLNRWKWISLLSNQILMQMFTFFFFWYWLFQAVVSSLFLAPFACSKNSHTSFCMVLLNLNFFVTINILCKGEIILLLFIWESSCFLRLNCVYSSYLNYKKCILYFSYIISSALQ